jgi:hypothetical protein
MWTTGQNHVVERDLEVSVGNEQPGFCEAAGQQKWGRGLRRTLSSAWLEEGSVPLNTRPALSAVVAAGVQPVAPPPGLRARALMGFLCLCPSVLE